LKKIKRIKKISNKKMTSFQEQDKKENFVGQLDTFCRHNSLPSPNYKFEKDDNGWTCHSEIPNHPHFLEVGKTKKSAKHEVARVHLDWLKKNTIRHDKKKEELDMVRSLVEEIMEYHMSYQDQYKCEDFIEKISQHQGILLKKQQVNKAIYDLALDGFLKRRVVPKGEGGGFIVYWLKHD
jgi:hypothetical protein